MTIKSILFSVITLGSIAHLPQSIQATDHRFSKRMLWAVNHNEKCFLGEMRKNEFLQQAQQKLKADDFLYEIYALNEYGKRTKYFDVCTFIGIATTGDDASLTKYYNELQQSHSTLILIDKKPQNAN